MLTAVPLAFLFTRPRLDSTTKTERLGRRCRLHKALSEKALPAGLGLMEAGTHIDLI